MLPGKSLDKKQNQADTLSRNHLSSKAVLAGGKRSWKVLAEPKYDRQSQQKPTMMDSRSIRKRKLADKFIPCARGAKTLKPENSTKAYVTASVTASPSNRPHALLFLLSQARQEDLSPYRIAHLTLCLVHKLSVTP